MKVRFGKVLLDVDVTVESTVDDLRNSLKELTDCEEIKLIASGKVLADGNMKIQSIPGGENSKITMIGSKPVNQPDPEELKKYRVRDDLDNSKAVYKKKKI